MHATECFAFSSRDWVCPRCNMPNVECLPDPLSEGSSNKSKDQTCASDAAAASETANMSDVSFHSSDQASVSYTDEKQILTNDAANPEGVAEEKQETPVPSIEQPVTDRIPVSPSSSDVITAHPASIQTSSPRRSPRPPVFLDVMIAVLLFVVASMMLKKLTRGDWLGFITS